MNHVCWYPRHIIITVTRRAGPEMDFIVVEIKFGWPVARDRRRRERFFLFIAFAPGNQCATRVWPRNERKIRLALPAGRA